MRAVLHKDRVKARIVRHDRKNRPEGRVTEIIELHFIGGKAVARVLMREVDAAAAAR